MLHVTPRRSADLQGGGTGPPSPGPGAKGLRMETPASLLPSLGDVYSPHISFFQNQVLLPEKEEAKGGQEPPRFGEGFGEPCSVR